jgi:opine dehydrogenase
LDGGLHVRRITVIGAGPGGIGTAALLARRGYEVTLANRTAERLEPLVARGGIEIEGKLGEGLVPLERITTDLAAAVADAEIVLIATPAYGQVPLADAIGPHVRPGTVVLLLTGSAGTLEVAPVLQRHGVDLDEVLLGETVTLPQSGRMVAPARIRLLLEARLRIAAFPGRNTDRLVAALDGLYQWIPTPHVLDPGLNNPNFLIHPAPMLLNYAAIERAEGRFSLMNEGMTEATLRLLDAVDAEKMALQAALGLEVVTIDEQYTSSGNGPWVYREKGEPFGLHDRIWRRYVTEDVPYGSVLYSSLGRLIGVPTPVCDGINVILCAVEERAYWAEGWPVARLGLAGLDLDGLRAFLVSGNRPAPVA